MHVGLDIGYSRVKLAYRPDTNPIIQMLTVGTGRRRGMPKGDDNTHDASGSFRVIVNGENWAAVVSLSDILVFVRTVDSGYLQTPKHLALFREALTHIVSPEIDARVIGIPIIQFNDDSSCSARRERIERGHEAIQRIPAQAMPP